MYEKYIKRMIDFVGAIVGIFLCIPLFIVIGILIRINLGAPIIYKQKRITKNQKVFSLYKFRTMTDQKDSKGKLLSDTERLTKLGNFLRSTSLDELPELINIIKGDLSFIGPRPLVIQYLPYFTLKEQMRHKVSGGLIPPEVLYHNITPTWEEQFRYEISYAKAVTFLLDVKILLATLKGIHKRKRMEYGKYVRCSFDQERTQGILRDLDQEDM